MVEVGFSLLDFRATFGCDGWIKLVVGAVVVAWVGVVVVVAIIFPKSSCPVGFRFGIVLLSFCFDIIS